MDRAKIEKMVADFRLVIEGIRGHERTRASSLDQQTQSAYAELVWRLDESCTTFQRLVNLNAQLMRLDLQFELDPNTNELVVRSGGREIGSRLKLNPTDPSVPLQIRQLVSKTTFKAGTTANTISYEPQARALSAEVERLLESFYYGAFRATKLVSQLPDQKKFPFIAITWVRNDLIEHPKDVNLPQNFGYGNGGPFVRPVRSTGMKRDEQGVVANTEELLAELARRFPST